MVQKNQLTFISLPKKIGSPHPYTPKSSVPPSNLPTSQAIFNECSIITEKQISVYMILCFNFDTSVSLNKCTCTCICLTVCDCAAVV